MKALRSKNFGSWILVLEIFYGAKVEKTWYNDSMLPNLITAMLISIPKAHAIGTLDTSKWGFNLTLEEAVANVVDTLLLTISPIATALFVIGAFLYMISGDKDERKNQGKEFMIYALIGVAVVFGAKGILNLIMFFVYGS